MLSVEWWFSEAASDWPPLRDVHQPRLQQRNEDRRQEPEREDHDQREALDVRQRTEDRQHHSDRSQ